MNITIVLPYPQADQMTPVWAEEEGKIDFHRDSDRASRCTVSFAAVELKRYLPRTLHGCNVTFASSAPREGYAIELSVRDSGSASDCFEIIPTRNGLQIVGEGRTGALYGAYEFLRMQGWRWLSPGASGEVAPPHRDELAWPESRCAYEPTMELWRGFDISFASKESIELFIWMARNRMNLCTAGPRTVALCNKLGIRQKEGGHFIEKLLAPDRVMADGATVWEARRHWYGVPADGTPKKELALRTQFCVSQPDLVEYVSDQMIEWLHSDWRHAEYVSTWGFDTWGSTCQCPQCKALGNGSDQMLHFVSAIRARLDAAVADGRLARNIHIVMCAYEGTSTLQAPENGIPANLAAAGDVLVYYPINRCYEHAFCDRQCSTNDRYRHALEQWLRCEPGLRIVMGEYYNVSKFEDLPCLFHSTMAEDIRSYHRMGVRGMTYMHVPLSNWAMRALTQVMYGQLCWDRETDTRRLLSEYFHGRYGAHAGVMNRAYNLIEKAWANITDWRSWGTRSVLYELECWDGRPPAAPLKMDNHLESPENAIARGGGSIRLMQEAMRIIEDALTLARAESAKHTVQPLAHAVNPFEKTQKTISQQVEYHLGEDVRFLAYGIGVMRLMVQTVTYHHALCEADDAQADAAWKDLEHTMGNLRNLYVPLSYHYPGPGFICKDALERSQLHEVLTRCHGYRLEAAAQPRRTKDREAIYG